MVVIIGRTAAAVTAATAMECVAGYTNGHDVSARDWQLQRNGQQWLLGKSFDTFAPIGPALVTADEVPDPHALRVQFRLNGTTLQESNTRQLIFPIPQLIAHVSSVATLRPGDLIFTGTPGGVGFARQPQVFLKPGDTCEVEVEGLGVLRNACVARHPA
jgi:2-keto-4-pentenoate hydratase/2-oxohepta-3-ene-1,7-dioic acid hydratase in catechol pathway